jgi:hypothetical protein
VKFVLQRFAVFTHNFPFNNLAMENCMKFLLHRFTICAHRCHKFKNMYEAHISRMKDFCVCHVLKIVANAACLFSQHLLDHSIVHKMQFPKTLKKLCINDFFVGTRR